MTRFLPILMSLLCLVQSVAERSGERKPNAASEQSRPIVEVGDTLCSHSFSHRLRESDANSPSATAKAERSSGAAYLVEKVWEASRATPSFVTQNRRLVSYLWLCWQAKHKRSGVALA